MLNDIKREAEKIIEDFITKADGIPNIDILSCAYGYRSPSGLVPVKAGTQNCISDTELDDNRMLDFCYGDHGQLSVEVYNKDHCGSDSVTGMKKCIMDAQEYFDKLLGIFKRISDNEKS